MPLKINIEIQMLKYLQRFAFTKKDRHVFKAFQEENLTIDGWVKYHENKIGAFNLKWRNGKRQIPVKIFFFRNEQLISTHKNNCTTI